MGTSYSKLLGWGFGLLSLLIPQVGWSATYYVDAINGQDSNVGLSPSTPWKSVSRVNSFSLKPDDRVLFKRGQIWRDTLVPPTSGTTEEMITFGAYGDGKRPVISGADDTTTNLTRWTLSANGTNEYYLKASDGRTSPISEPMLVWLNQDCISKARVGSLVNHEWDWADNDGLGYKTLYVRTETGDPSETNELIEVGNRDNALSIIEKSNLTFENLEFRQSDANWGGVVKIANSQKLSFRNCSVHDGNYAVFYAYATGSSVCGEITLDSCAVYACRKSIDPYGSVIKFDSCQDNNIKNSVVYGGSNATWSDIITLYNSDNNIIDNNSIYGPAGNGIYARPNSDSNMITRNVIHGITGPAMQIRENSNNNKIYYNVFHDNGLAIQSDGDLPINGTEIFNNTVYNTGTGSNGIHINHTNTNCLIENNIVFVGQNADALFVHPSSISGVISDYNLFRNLSGTLIAWGTQTFLLSDFSTYRFSSKQDIHSITYDPQFRDVAGNDFHLEINSPCIDTGVNVELTHDLTGTPIPQGDSVDLGAIEFKSFLSPPTNLRIVFTH